MRQRFFRKQPNFLPMLDVIFILLFFLMFSLVIAAEQGVLNINLPKIKQQANSEKGTKIIVQLDKNGEIEFKGKQYDSISKFLKDLKANKVKSIYLAADGDLEYRKVMELIGGVKSSGTEKVNLIFESQNSEAK